MIFREEFKIVCDKQGNHTLRGKMLVDDWPVRFVQPLPNLAGSVLASSLKTRAKLRVLVRTK
jgi:hypothetical protein